MFPNRSECARESTRNGERAGKNIDAGHGIGGGVTDIVPELVAEISASELKEEPLGGLSRRGDTNTLENSAEDTWRGEGK